MTERFWMCFWIVVAISLVSIVGLTQHYKKSVDEKVLEAIRAGNDPIEVALAFGQLNGSETHNLILTDKIRK
jgi:hypothetical protein